MDVAAVPFPKTRLIGQHNQINASAAYLAASRFGVTMQEASLAMEAFTPIPNRLEYTGTIDGVDYVNDSKCTTVEALKVALASFHKPVILLAGGKFKGGDLEGIRSLVRQHVRAVALYGASREHFENAWKDIVPVTWDKAMDQALDRARALAKTGDTVLLAPATSSFDQYKNYVERGNHFKSLVHAMGEKG
jgi:UDP-N-acetylmuramoylalanine--D-glutamate ligase